MWRAIEKTSTCQRENGQLVERRAPLFVVTDGHALSRPRLIFIAGDQSVKRIKESIVKRERWTERSVLKILGDLLCLH